MVCRIARIASGKTFRGNQTGATVPARAEVCWGKSSKRPNHRQAIFCTLENPINWKNINPKASQLFVHWHCDHRLHHKAEINAANSHFHCHCTDDTLKSDSISSSYVIGSFSWMHKNINYTWEETQWKRGNAWWFLPEAAPSPDPIQASAEEEEEENMEVSSGGNIRWKVKTREKKTLNFLKKRKTSSTDINVTILFENPFNRPVLSIIILI